jgi:hypothetical protein
VLPESFFSGLDPAQKDFKRLPFSFTPGDPWEPPVTFLDIRAF